MSEKNCLDIVVCPHCQGKGCSSCNHVGKVRLGDHNFVSAPGKNDYPPTRCKCTFCGTITADMDQSM
jgi:hypothetical protein